MDLIALSERLISNAREIRSELWLVSVKGIELLKGIAPGIEESFKLTLIEGSVHIPGIICVLGNDTRTNWIIYSDQDPLPIMERLFVEGHLGRLHALR